MSENTETDTPRDRFLRLAPARTEKVLHNIKLLGNCTGHGYEYTPVEAQEILDALFDAVHDLKRKFEKKKAKGHIQFSFKSSPEDRGS